MHIVLLHFYSAQPNPIYAQIAVALRARGHRVWVGAPDANHDLVWQDGTQVIATIPGPQRTVGLLKRLPLPRLVRQRLARLAFVLRLRRFLRQHQPDVVQINPASMQWIWLMPLFMPAAMRFVLDWRQIGQRGGKGVIRAGKAWFTGVWRQLYANLYDQSCFLHEAGAIKLLGRGWQRKGRVVPLAVDEQFLTAVVPETAAPVTPAGGDPCLRFIYVGSLSRVRRLERLIEAASLLAARGLAFQLHLVGPDNADGYYQELIQARGLQSQVAVLPAVPYAQVPTTLLTYDVALAYVPEYPADWQYHPTVKVLEYRALGMPIIASDFAPNREVVQQEVNGLLVANDPTALANAMARFMTDQRFYLRCRTNAREMRTGVTWPKIAQRYEELYLEGRQLLAT